MASTLTSISPTEASQSPRARCPLAKTGVGEQPAVYGWRAGETSRDARRCYPRGAAAGAALAVPQCGTRWYHHFVADHFTLRLAPGLRQRLNERALRARMPERTLAQRYVEEGLRHDAHPLIQFLDGPSGRRASLVGRGLNVWEVVATVRDNEGSITEAAEYLQIPTGLVEAAVTYYGEYRDEIDAEIELNEAEYERGRAAAAAGERALRG